MNTADRNMQRFTARWATGLSLIVLATFAAPVFAAEVTAEVAVPQIAECSIGFNGTFKVGHWTPIWVTTAGDMSAGKYAVDVITIDSDGVEVTTSTAAESAQPTLLYVRSGRLASPVRVILRDENSRIVDRAELSAEQVQAGGAPYNPLPATGQLVLQIGPGEIGLASALRIQEAADGSVASGVVKLDDVASLPTEWFGYEAVDVLLFATSDAEFCERLTADEQRFAALRQWLELGGRLVLCGSRSATQPLSPGGSLAVFVPGKITEIVRLPQTQSLETFAGSGDAISQSGAQQNIPLPLLADVEGQVRLFGRGTDLPIVVRAARGLGELVFVGVDLTEPPFVDWSGRGAFLEAVLRPYLADADANRAKQKLVSLGYDDLAGALRQRLGRSFAGVASIGFPWVALLVIGYLVLLGPLDYFFVQRVTRRSWVAWLTLPLIVLATSAGAALLAGAAKSTDAPRFNHAELVDFDLTTGRTRGICWATLYSSRAKQFDVTLAPQLPSGKPAAGAQTLVSWLGLPGSGLGGMHAAGEPIDVAGVGYREADHLSALSGLPVLTASTKSLLARWDLGPPSPGGEPQLLADLSLDDDGMLVGSITNSTGAPLAGAYVLHGRWGYRLGELSPAEQIEIGPQLGPKQVKSIVTRRSRTTSASDADIFLASRATADELLDVMMFYEAAGGEAFAGLPNRYQSDCDLSALLDLDRAILVAQGTQSGSQWTNTTTGESLETDDDASTIVYRFIIPLNSQPSTLKPEP